MGERDDPFEDYPPWGIVTEIQAGTFTWGDNPRSGTYAAYAATWVPEAENAATWEELGVTLSEF